MGPNYSISTACATANYAFHAAANHIRNGDADVMVVGGAEAPVMPAGLGGFVACRALSTRCDEPQKASRCARARMCVCVCVCVCVLGVGCSPPSSFLTASSFLTPSFSLMCSSAQALGL